MNLIPEATKAHRLWSVQGGCVTTLLALAEAFHGAVPLWEGVIPPGAFAALAAATASVTMVLRVIKQTGLRDDDD